MKHFIFFLLLIFFPCVQIYSSDFLEGCQVSLLTVKPYNEALYTIYGHSALRIYSPRQHINTVYNWGTFDVHSSFFLYHFLKGDANYFLSSSNYSSFVQFYNSVNATIIEQVLFFPLNSKKYFLQKIFQNLKLKNRMYRYNFLQNNCTTHIRDLIENTLDGFALFGCPNKGELKTFRQWMHVYTAPYPWIEFFIDLCIGNKADQLLSQRESLFLPMNFKKKITNFKYKSGIPLVTLSRNIISGNKQGVYYLSFIIHPNQFGWILVCFYGVLFFILEGCFYLKINKCCNFLNAINNGFAFLFFLYGLVGSLIIFFVIFSFHPFTSPNWNLVWVHPFHLLAFIGFYLKNRFYYWMSIYHKLDILVLSLYSIWKMWRTKEFISIIDPYIICLIIASLFFLRKDKLKIK